MGAIFPPKIKKFLSFAQVWEPQCLYHYENLCANVYYNVLSNKSGLKYIRTLVCSGGVENPPGVPLDLTVSGLCKSIERCNGAKHTKYQ